ncbi:hypothetical protein Plhal304r1_c002g0007401 [Plasmopara halstedii]
MLLWRGIYLIMVYCNCIIVHIVQRQYSVYKQKHRGRTRVPQPGAESRDSKATECFVSPRFHSWCTSSFSHVSVFVFVVPRITHLPDWCRRVLHLYVAHIRLIVESRYLRES